MASYKHSRSLKCVLSVASTVALACVAHGYNLDFERVEAVKLSLSHKRMQMNNDKDGVENEMQSQAPTE